MMKHAFTILAVLTLSPAVAGALPDKPTSFTVLSHRVTDGVLTARVKVHSPTSLMMARVSHYLAIYGTIQAPNFDFEFLDDSGKTIGRMKTGPIASNPIPAASIGLAPSSATAASQVSAQPYRYPPQQGSPASSDRIVYVTGKGKKYHSSPGCRTLSRSDPRGIPLSRAQSAGYTACQVCGP